MRVRVKVLLITGLILVLLIAILYPVITVFLMGTFEDLEDRNARRDIEIVRDELDKVVEGLDSGNNILSSSDDAYEFAKTGSTSYIDEHMGWETYQLYEANMIMVLSNDGEVLYNGSYDLLTQLKANFPPELRGQIKANEIFYKFSDTKDFHTGFISYSKHILIVSARPILTGTRQGPIAGSMVMMRFFTKDTIFYDMHTKSSFELDYHNLRDDYTPNDYREVIEEGNRNGITLKKMSRSRMAGYMFIDDIYDDPVFILKVEMDRDITMQVFEALMLYFFLLVVVLIIGVLIFAFIVETVVINRLTRLENEVNVISEQGHNGKRVKVSGKDEIRNLGASINGMLQSIEEKQKMVKQSEEKYRKLVNLSPTGIAIAVDDKIVFLNSTGSNMLGLKDPSTFYGRSVWDFVSSENEERAHKIPDQLDKMGHLERPLELPIRRMDASPIEIELMATRFKYEDKEATMFIFLDVTELNKTRREIAERELRYRTLFEMSTDAILLLKEGVITACNKATLDLFEADVKDIIGSTPVDISVEVQPDGRISEEEVPRIISDLDMGEPVSFDWDHRTLKGKVLHTEVSLTKIVLNDEEYLFSIVHDMTERKIQQQRIIKEKSRSDLYLDLLGHDVGNLHQGIYSSLEMALMCAVDQEKCTTYINKSRDLTMRSIKLVKNVKVLSQDRESMHVVLDLNELVENAMRKTVSSFPEIVIDLKLDGPDRPVKIVTDSIVEEAIYNILHNAVKAQLRTGPVIEMTIEVRENTVDLLISDHGPGIPDERKVNLFDRGKSGGSLRYTGLGLTLVKKLMTNHGRDVYVRNRVEGDPSKGTTFILRFNRCVVDDVEDN